MLLILGCLIFMQISILFFCCFILFLTCCFFLCDFLRKNITQFFDIKNNKKDNQINLLQNDNFNEKSNLDLFLKNIYTIKS